MPFTAIARNADLFSTDTPGIDPRANMDTEEEEEWVANQGKKDLESTFRVLDQLISKFDFNQYIVHIFIRLKLKQWTDNDSMQILDCGEGLNRREKRRIGLIPQKTLRLTLWRMQMQVREFSLPGNWVCSLWMSLFHEVAVYWRDNILQDSLATRVERELSTIHKHTRISKCIRFFTDLPYTCPVEKYFPT